MSIHFYINYNMLIISILYSVYEVIKLFENLVDFRFVSVKFPA